MNHLNHLRRICREHFENRRIGSNAIDPANPVNKWGYRGVPGKGGKTTNAVIISKSEN